MCESVTQEYADENANPVHENNPCAEEAAMIETLTKERDEAIRAYESTVLANHGVSDECACDVLLLAKAAGGRLDDAVENVLTRYPCFARERSRLTLSLPLTVEGTNDDSALRQAFGL